MDKGKQIEALKEKLFSSITYEMDQAAYQAFSGYGEGWSDLEVHLRHVLISMLVASDSKSTKAIREILLLVSQADEVASKSIRHL